MSTAATVDIYRYANRSISDDANICHFGLQADGAGTIVSLADKNFSPDELAWSKDVSSMH